MKLELPDQRFRTLDMRLSTPAQINRSAWTGRRTVMRLPGTPRWSVSAEHVPIIDAGEVRAWRAFFARLRGATNSFRLAVAQGGQHAGPLPLADASDAGLGAVRATGMAPNAVLLRAGHYATFQLVTGDEQLVILTSDVNVGGDGAALMTFEPPLRAATAPGATIQTVTPYVLAALDESSVAWAVDPGAIYGFALTASEAF